MSTSSSARSNPATAQFQAHPKGDVWAAQQLGVDDEPTVCIEYGGGPGLTMEVEDLPSLRKAIDGVLGAFGMEASDERPGTGGA